MVRGPSALLHGSGALGGVISMIRSMQRLLQEGQSSGFVFGTGVRGTIAWD
ncbi:hypothetical protein MJ568_18285 [Escherichia coli]|nr:hypothetical protein MJ568_18285 [Escherichia coli]